MHVQLSTHCVHHTVGRHRTLGWRALRSRDAEGIEFGPARLKEAFCYDVPVDATLRRLLQTDPRAWAQVQEACERWANVSDAYKKEKLEEMIFFDIPDGTYFRDHPELGINAPKDGSLRLAFILYYDGLGTTNALGAFAHTHNMGLFYYALVNLEPSIRMALPYIQLVTVAYESDIKHFGPELVVSGPIDEDPETGTSFGAAMRRLGREQGIELQVPCSTGGYEPQKFRGWLLLIAADHPAAAKLLTYKESVAAKRPCRECDWNHGTKAQEAPAAYGRPSSFLSADALLRSWTLRSEASEAAVRANLEAKGAQAALSTRNAVLAEAGYKDEHKALPVAQKNEAKEAVGPGAVGPTGFRRANMVGYFQGGLRSSLRIPYAPRTAPQDLMHTIFEGIGKMELAAFLYMAIVLFAWFTLPELNSAILDFDWGGGPKPDAIQPSAIEGTREHMPKPGCHVHYHAAVMKNFMVHSERFFGQLFRKKGRSDVLDGTATGAQVWLCWLALVSATIFSLKYSFTYDEVLELDQLILCHQELFAKIPQYGKNLYKPKHHFCTHLPHNILFYGPLRHFWCFRFEAMNQIIKKIAQGGNYGNPPKRIATYWCFKSARDIKSGKLASWGTTHAVQGEALELVLRESMDEIHKILFSLFFPFHLELMVASVAVLSHLGDVFRPQNWVLIGYTGDMPYLGRIKGIDEAEHRFFVTVVLHDTKRILETGSSASSRITAALELPLQEVSVEVICVDDVLMQPVMYEEREGFAQISLIL